MYKLFLKGTTSMSEDTFGFNELTDAAQDNALETFAKYYVRQFKQDNLEIIDALAGDDEAVAMINQILEENNYLTVAKLAAMSISMVKSCYVKILNELSARFDADGEPVKAWAEWMQSEHAKLPQED
jgi:hypothetical protein